MQNKTKIAVVGHANIGTICAYLPGLKEQFTIEEQKDRGIMIIKEPPEFIKTTNLLPAKELFYSGKSARNLRRANNRKSKCVK